MTALRTDSLRCSGVKCAALASPPFRPPFLPNLDRYSRNPADDLIAIARIHTQRVFLGKQRFLLAYVDGLRIGMDMNTLSRDGQSGIGAAHVEGNSMFSLERIARVHRDTIMRLMGRISAARSFVRILKESRHGMENSSSWLRSARNDD